ncbi:hypothetical protein EON81_27570 [bacterium]|nr:MAG: hypothetical protein EON81_27570 [bacterium]
MILAWLPQASPSVLTAPLAPVPIRERRAILAVVADSAFRHPRRHRLIATMLNADARFAFVALHRADDAERADSDREIRRFFDPIGDHGDDTEFFLRKSGDQWRIMFWMPVTSEGQGVGRGYVFDYRPLMATGFPARLAPANLRRTWATKWVFTEKGTRSTIVTDVAELDRHRDSDDEFRLDGYTVYRHGLNRP